MVEINVRRFLSILNLSTCKLLDMVRSRTICFPKETKKSTLKTRKERIPLKFPSAVNRCSVKFLMTWQFSGTKRTVTFQLVQLPLFPVCHLMKFSRFPFQGHFNRPKAEILYQEVSDQQNWPICILWVPAGQLMGQNFTSRLCFHVRKKQFFPKLHQMERLNPNGSC